MSGGERQQCKCIFLCKWTSSAQNDALYCLSTYISWLVRLVSSRNKPHPVGVTLLWNELQHFWCGKTKSSFHRTDTSTVSPPERPHVWADDHLTLMNGHIHCGRMSNTLKSKKENSLRKKRNLLELSHL